MPHSAPSTPPVILITGAGRGLGRAAALAFARCGASLALNDVTPINLDHTLAAVREAGVPARDYIADVGKQMPVESLIDRILTDFGRLDALVNAAGVRPSQTLFALDEWDWRRTLDVNLAAPFFTTQIAGRAMQRQGGGAIVNFGVLPGWPARSAAGVAFAASRMGVVGLTQTAAREFTADKIRVNVICPAVAGFQPGSNGVLSAGALLPPGAPVALPERIAALTVHLCDPATDLTGQVVLVDGWELSA